MWLWEFNLLPVLFLPSAPPHPPPAPEGHAALWVLPVSSAAPGSAFRTFIWWCWCPSYPVFCVSISPCVLCPSYSVFCVPILPCVLCPSYPVFCVSVLPCVLCGHVSLCSKCLCYHVLCVAIFSCVLCVHDVLSFLCP